jgi:hypothetical protein
MKMLAAIVSGPVILASLLFAGLPPAAAAPTLADRASQAGVYVSTQTWASTPVDYNMDGREDVWVGFHQWGGRLFRNEGNGTYTRVALNAWPRTNSQGAVPDRHDCAFADVDRNGLPDAYCTTGRNQSNYVKGSARDNELWLQTSVGNFTEVGTQWGVGDDCGRGRFAVFFDANGDGWPDLFFGNETPRNVSDPCDNAANGYPNEESKLLLNTGGTGLVYAPSFYRFGAGPGQRCAVTLDYNRDGRTDLLACRLRSNTPRLYRNNAGTSFTEVGAAAHLTTNVVDAVTGDLNKDGWTDLFFAAGNGCSYRLNTNGVFGPLVTVKALPSGQARSVAVGDADGDGDLDVYCMARADGSNPNDFVMLNNGTGWTSLTVPAAPGDGDEVNPLFPFGATGPAQFLVLNGGNSSEAGGSGGGPVQLIQTLP